MTIEIPKMINPKEFDKKKKLNRIKSNQNRIKEINSSGLCVIIALIGNERTTSEL